MASSAASPSQKIKLIQDDPTFLYTSFTPITMADCYTPCNTDWNSNSYSPLTHVHFQDSCFISITFLFSILTLTLDSVLGTPYSHPCPTFPIPCPLPIYPDRGFCNPVLDLLIPLLHSQPCIVPSSYKSEPPMYSRPSSNLD